jgi:hypothetical protein
VTARQEDVDVRPLLDEMLGVAREGMARSGWRIGDSDEKLLLPIIGALTVFFGERLGVKDGSVLESLVRKKVAAELRQVAARHPAGTGRHTAFTEAARVAEQGQQ